MFLVLYLTGGVVLIISIIVGALSGSFWGFIAALASGILSSIVFFALANILEKQEVILSKLQQLEKNQRKYNNVEKKTCVKCSYEYDTDYTSCPHCGYRQ